jgi:hypothetical protein
MQYEFRGADFQIASSLDDPLLTEVVLSSPALGLARRDGEYLIAILIQTEETDASNTFVDIVSKRAGGEVDIEIAVGIEAHVSDVSRRVRPIEGGVSIGRADGTTGSLGCFVTRDGSSLEGLSVNHVIAASNAGEIGDEILQPGADDGGTLPLDRVGTLSYFHPLLPAPSANKVDAALFRLNEDLAAMTSVPPIGVVDLDPGDLVQKVGRTTSHTKGKVTAVDLDGVKIHVPGIGMTIFDGLTRIATSDGTAFSSFGDSGALVTDSSGENGAGIVVGGLSHRTWIVPLSTTLQVIGAEVVNYEHG